MREGDVRGEGRREEVQQVQNVIINAQINHADNI
jgi:hypothetical protein